MHGPNCKKENNTFKMGFGKHTEIPKKRPGKSQNTETKA
jgi:hypothetical protein